MPASSGGDGYRDDRQSPIRTLRERAGAAADGAAAEPRPLEEILPEQREAARGRDMQATWQAFCLERYDTVRTVLGSRRSPPEIAYQLGEAIHTYFRPRGLTLTSQELRRLVAELLDTDRGKQDASRTAASPVLSRPSSPQPPQPSAGPGPTTGSADTGSADTGGAGRGDAGTGDGLPSHLVSFRSKAGIGPNAWTGDERPDAPPAVAEAAFEPPPSPLVDVSGQAGIGFDRLLARTLELARPRLATSGRSASREEAVRAIEAALDEVVRAEEAVPPTDEIRQQVVLVALSEVCGLGLIDRLWADRSVRAVFVNGPKSVFVEREGGLAPAAELFRDQAHLLELVERLVERPASGVATFHLRDGGTGTIVFPPAAPDGPVLTLRRAEPGNATLARLIAAGLLDRKAAVLLRIAVRAQLKVLVTGETGAGKTALLAALGRDLETSARIVTLARHREFRWPAPAKVELVASRERNYGALLAAAESLRPQVLILDSLQAGDAGQAAALVARVPCGVLVACESVVPTAEFMPAVDLRVRLGRSRDGLFRVVAVEDSMGAVVSAYEDGHFRVRPRAPAFADKVRAAGFGEALAAILR
ncbi:MAG: Flp pilus assembly complex ATPase component TadA [Proteobacteria bacterium]|nr:Flp pilus assembly complex ATPase component TadA [Pseudomonadota bacterium]